MPKSPYTSEMTDRHRQFLFVQPIAALLYKETKQLDLAIEALTTALMAQVDFLGSPHPFDQTDYYAQEMGDGLQRVLVSFSPLVEPTFLVEARWKAHAVENQLAKAGNRTINVDMGYLDLFKLVLASFKPRGNKIYLDQGVWADMTLIFEKGRFQPLPWSFPDFKSGVFDKDLLDIRSRYKALLADTKTIAPPEKDSLEQ